MVSVVDKTRRITLYYNLKLLARMIKYAYLYTLLYENLALLFNEIFQLLFQYKFGSV